MKMPLQVGGLSSVSGLSLPLGPVTRLSAGKAFHIHILIHIHIYDGDECDDDGDDYDVILMAMVVVMIIDMIIIIMNITMMLTLVTMMQKYSMNILTFRLETFHIEC